MTAAAPLPPGRRNHDRAYHPLALAHVDGVRTPVDLAFDVASAPGHRVVARSRGVWEHGSPVADPVDSYRAVRAAARRVLPRVRFRHRLYWRYSLEWTAPVSA